MAGYKVSYKVLRQQGDDIKAAAKLIDGYAERVSQINGKLGDDEMLAGVRKNLSKLREQLGESRAILNTAGEFLVKTVDSYTNVEVKQVKKVEGTKAHNRDFYKNPVVVASAGGAIAGAGAAAASAAASPSSATAVNVTDNSVNTVNITYATPESAAAPVQEMQSAPAAQAAQPNVAFTDRVVPAAAGADVSSAASGMGSAAKIGAGVAGGAIAGVGGALGGMELKKRRDAKKSSGAGDDGAKDGGYDPEEELERAIRKVQEMEREE